MESLSYSVAKKLLQLKTFRLQVTNPFIWANGWSAPIYFDDRKILSYPYMRNFIKLELARHVAEMYPDADVIAGVAVNAIALSALVAEQVGLPLIYVHPFPKDHGLENQIEGELRPRQKVVVIENQVNEGVNLEHVVEAIRNNGCTVLGVVTIFNYDLEQAARQLQEADIEVTALTNFSSLLEVAKGMELWDDECRKILREWHKSPENYE